MKRLLLYILAACCLCSTGLPQISEQYNFSPITTEDGLTHNTISDIYKDSYGFVWLATWNGLERYDGYEFMHYNTKSVPMSIKSIFVKSIAEDSQQRLWIASEGGIDVMDLKTGAKIEFKLDNIKGAEIFDHAATSLLIDSHGSIWIGSESAMTYICTNAKGEPTAINTLFSDQRTIKVTLSESVANGVLLAGLNGKMYRLVYSNNTYTAVAMPETILNSIAEISTIFQDNNSIWIGTDLGLFVHNQQTGITQTYVHDLYNKRSLSQNYITDIVKDIDGNIIISTLHGLSIYDPRSNNFERVINDGAYRPNMLSGNFINCLYKDNNGIIWIGLDKGGINKMVKKRLAFRNFYHNTFKNTTLSPNPVNAIFEDSDHTMWVGTVEGGLNKMEGKLDDITFRHYTYSPNNPRSISHNSVSYITQDEDKNLWIGTWGGGINRASNRKADQISFERFTKLNVTTMPSDYIATMLYDKANNGFWVGTPSGLSFFQPELRRFTPIEVEQPNDNIRTVGTLLLDHKNRLWVGSGTGLFCIFTAESQPTQGKVKYIHFSGTEPGSSLSTAVKINTIMQSSDKAIWIGCMGNEGIYKITEGSESQFTIEQHNNQQELSQNSIYGIVEDNTGNLWLSTGNGLLIFSRDDQSIRSFYKNDGLLDNQFYWNASCGSSSGVLYFGNMSGLTYVNTNVTNVETQNLPPSITRLKISDQTKSPTHNEDSKDGQNRTQSIRVHEREKSLSIEFSALNYENPAKIKYVYRLVGFDNQWTEVGSTRRFASYTNLRWGHYTFEVKCTNIDGRWSESVGRLEIYIVPFFYKTWWFILISIVILLFAAWSAYQYRIRAFHRKNEMLKRVVDERTKEIHAQKVSLEEKASQLSETLSELIIHKEEVSRQNNILTAQNMKITRQKEQILTMSKRVEELFIDKIAFFTNITHELRTPVTLISGPIDKALSITKDDKVVEQLNFAKRNAAQLLLLINQLMDFRKVDSQNMKITKRQGNFIEYLDSVLLSFTDYAAERNISINKNYKIENPMFMYDEDNMQKVLANLMSNAIKFTPNDGTITVTASSFTDTVSEEERLSISVRDSGNGIPEGELEHIFEKFYQSKETQRFSFRGQSGTGIGLFLCKRVVEMDGGVIKAMNNPDVGACFTITLSITRAAKDEISDAEQLDGTTLEQQSQQTHIGINLEEFDNNKQLILVVDDSTDMRNYIRSILSDHYNVILAENGKFALEMLSQYQPSIIISDIMMPVMDGIEFTKRAKNNFQSSHIPIVMLTAKTSTESQVESYDCGADAFICKPFNEEVMLACLRSLLEQRSRMQAKFLYNMDAEELGISEQSQDRQFMNKALEIIKNNYTDPEFDVAAFTNLMGMSRSLTYKKLQSLAGQPANKFIRIYRLNLARELIGKCKDDKSMNISEIAYQVGFNDPKYFTRCFTKHFGYPPSKKS